PVCASPSTINGPGITGYPGKWSAKYSSARLRFFSALADLPLWNSRNRSIQTHRISGSSASGLGRVLRVGSGFLDLQLDVAGDQFHREQLADLHHLRVLLELAEVGERHPRPQLGQALLGDLAVGDELRVALEDRLREQLAARDLDAELALQAEHDVQEVD